MIHSPSLPSERSVTSVDAMELTMLMITTPVRMTVSIIEAQARMTELIWGNLLNYRDRC